MGTHKGGSAFAVAAEHNESDVYAFRDAKHVEFDRLFPGPAGLDPRVPGQRVESAPQLHRNANAYGGVPARQVADQEVEVQQAEVEQAVAQAAVARPRRVNARFVDEAAEAAALAQEVRNIMDFFAAASRTFWSIGWLPGVF